MTEVTAGLYVEILREFTDALEPLIGFRNRRLDERHSELPDLVLHLAAERLDAAFNAIDSAVRVLENPDDYVIGWSCTTCEDVFTTNEHADNGCPVSGKYIELVPVYIRDLERQGPLGCCCDTNPGECPIHEGTT